MRSPLPPVAVVVGFLDAINRGDIDRLCSLMTDEHRLQVLDAAPVAGREAYRDAWIGYATAYPNYVVYPSLIVDRGAEGNRPRHDDRIASRTPRRRGTQTGRRLASLGRRRSPVAVGDHRRHPRQPHPVRRTHERGTVTTSTRSPSRALTGTIANASASTSPPRWAVRTPAAATQPSAVRAAGARRVRSVATLDALHSGTRSATCGVRPHSPSTSAARAPTGSRSRRTGCPAGRIPPDRPATPPPPSTRPGGRPAARRRWSRRRAAALRATDRPHRRPWRLPR